MKTRRQIITKKIHTAVGAAALMLSAADATAVQNAGGMATNLLSQVSAVKLLLLAASGLAGLFLVIVGILTLIKDSRQKQPGDNKKGVMMLVGGIALIGIVSVVFIAQQTILGSTDTKTFKNSGGF